MRSKLFRAVVGVGLSLGGSGAGCSGNSTSDDDGSGGDPNGTGGKAGSGGTAGDPHAGTAGLPTDAGTDAFCDAAWPTTKGNPAPPPSCEEQAECGGPPDAGFGFLRCRPKLDEHLCDYLLVTSECENGVWQCPADAMVDSECWCIGPPPTGYICTEMGFQLADGGTGGSSSGG